MLGRTDRSEWRTHRIYGYANGLGERKKEGEREWAKRQSLRDEGKEEEGKKGKEGSYSGAFRKGRGRQQVGTQCHK